MDNRILIITKNYPPQIGGIEKYAEQTYKTLISKGSKVYLIKTFPRLDSFFLIIPVNFFSKLFFLFYEFIRLFYLLIQIVFVGPFLVRKVDIIWWIDASLAPVCLLVQFFNKNSITRITCHARDVVWNNSLYQSFMPFFWNKINQIYCVSVYTKEAFCFRSVNRNVSIHQNDPNIFFSQNISSDIESIKRKLKIPLDKMVIFSLWRFVPKKWFDWFLKDVMPFISKKYLYILWWTGPLYFSYKQIILDNKLDNVYLLGPIFDSIKKDELFSVADFFLIPTIPVIGDQEGYPIVFSEAVNHNCFIVASDCFVFPYNYQRIKYLPCSVSQEWINYLNSHTCIKSS